MIRSTLFALIVIAPAVSNTFAAPADDLNPVTPHDAVEHPPITLVEAGQPRASIAVMAGGPAAAAAAHLQQFIERATGAQLPIVQGQITAPAIVLGDCDAAAALGLVGGQMPVEGFAIKSAPDHIFLVGNDAPVGPGATSQGTLWAAIEFLERFVGVRWYFPGELGQSVPWADTLRLDPVWLSDAPAFRKREIWPPVSIPSNGTGTQLQPLHTFLRAANSWPNQLVVHSPNWAPVAEYKEQRPEVFQLRSDNTRDFSMLCYGNRRTLDTYLENIARAVAGETPAYIGLNGRAVTVSPADAEIACYCPDCRRMWNSEGGQYGSASRIVGQFAADLGREVKQRWPDLTVLYLPYLNYTLPPAGVEFPDNVEVQLCGMPGLAMYKEPAIAASEQATIDSWIRLTGRPIQNWHYSCWPANRTKAAYQYPHVVKAFYQANRDKTVGTFINGETDHWPRQNISLYCWMKTLWDPDFDVEAATDEFCRRMFGPAAGTMRQLVTLQTTGWEEGRFTTGRLSAKGVYEIAFPRDRVLHMEALLGQARQEAAADPLSVQRVEYYAGPLIEFFQESRDYAEGTGLRPLLAQVAGEHPTIDGRLDEEVWSRADTVPFIRGWDKAQKDTTYPTTVQGVWTREGVTFGFRMSEPTPDRLERKINGRDDSLAWWDDNVELLFDVTGDNEGEFYHLIINVNNAVADARGTDFAWNMEGLKTATHVGEDFWSLEVYLPFAAFPATKIPGTGMGAVWSGNFTRHRVADRGLNPTVEALPASQREYQRMNTTYALPSNNLSDFAPIRFVE
jgi:hypothetical protein